MSSYITIATVIFLLICLSYIYRTRTIKDLDRLHEINTEIKREFQDYKIQAFNLSEHLAKYVEERNEMIDEAIRVITLLLGQLKDNQDFLNALIIDEVIKDLQISLKRKDDTKDYQSVIAFLKTARHQTDIINDRIKHEVDLIKRLLERSNHHVFNNITSMLFMNKPYKE